jgi:hypothetical protein
VKNSLSVGNRSFVLLLGFNSKMLSPGTANHGISNDIIFDWFRKLDNWNRIDFICGLLDLCHPFEIRYLGTFIEELGRKDYAALKTHEERANSEIKKEITNLKDPAVRSRLTISLTLLSSNNYKGKIASK